jgi:hypothetical protein
MGYHGFITEGLVDLIEWLDQAGTSLSTYWQGVNRNAPYNLAAALAWIVNIQRSDGGINDQAPTSTSATTTAWGTSVGIALGARIMQLLLRRGFAPSTPIKVDYTGRQMSLEDLGRALDQSVSFAVSPAGLPYGAAFLGDYMSWSMQERFGITK